MTKRWWTTRGGPPIVNQRPKKVVGNGFESAEARTASSDMSAMKKRRAGDAQIYNMYI